MDVFDLAAKLTLDTGNFEEGLSGAQKSANSFSSKLGNGLKKAGKAAAAGIAVATTAVTALGGAMMGNISRVAELGDNIDKQSQKIGFSAEGYQEWDFILQHCGASIDSLQSGMKTLQVAAENGSDAFDELGISQKDLEKMSPEELFEATVEALQNVDDETQRTKLATQLLGKAGTELGPLLNSSAEDVAAMKDQVHELGGVMSDEAVANAAAYQDAIQNLQTAFRGLGNNLSAEFLPAVTTVAEGLTDILTGNGDEGLGKISEGIDQIVTGITDKLPDLLEVGTTIVTTLLDAIIENLPKLLEAGAEVLGQLIVGIVEAIPDLVAMIPDIITAIVTGLAEAGPDLLAAGVELLNMIVDGASSVLTSVTDLGSTIVSDISTGISNAWSTLTTTITTLVSGIPKLFEDAFNDAKDAVSKVIDKIKGFLDFKFELPSIPLPHFSVVPAGWKIGDLLKGVIPSLGIEWYAKAYNNPYVFNKPTVMGFGDGNGGEMVYGHENLMNDIREAAGDNRGVEARLDELIVLFTDIARNGLSANISGSQLYRSVNAENQKRTRATSYNGLASAAY